MERTHYALACAMDAAFEFPIGTIVYFRAAVHDATHLPAGYMVCQRLAEQCPNGVQLLYRFNGDATVHHEIALTATMPAYQPIDPEQLADQRAQKLHDYDTTQIIFEKDTTGDDE